MKALAKIALAFIATGALVFTANAGTIDDVKKRGELRCVTSTGLAGFAYPDAKASGVGSTLTSAGPRQPLYLGIRPRSRR